MRRAVVLTSLLVLAVAAVAPGAAWASWSSSGSGSATAKAQVMPTGSTPTVSVSNRNVTVSWGASTLPGGAAVGGYTVKRYDASTDALQTIGASCTGTIAALTCTETAVAPGSWRYTVTPVKQNWVGGESAKSSTATVDVPSLSFSSSTTITSLPRTLSGSVASYIPGETITFRLDNPTSGTVLTGSTTPSPIGSGGSATLSVTIPAGTTNGSHTVYAVGSGGSTASASILVDSQAPTVSAAAISKTQGGTPGFIKQGGTYYVYANVTDGGSGVATVTANVSTVTTGQTAAALSSGSFVVGGVTYNYRSAQITANAGLAAGAKAFSITAADAAGNSGTQSGFSVTVDNTAPAASNVQTTNVGGGTTGTAETGDALTLTYSETMDPNSILSGWTGTGTTVTLRLIDGGAGNDSVQIWDSANTAQLPLGSVNLGNTGQVTASVAFTGSTMTQSGAVITITLGTPSGATTRGTASQMVWTPSATATDRAANACSTTAVNESGGNDRNF
jgi:hypothetical protein